MSEPGAQVGILLRNRPASVGLLLGVLSAGGCVVTINPGRGVDRTRDDIAELDLPVYAGDPADLAELVREVVIHEVAHYFGIDDDRLDELGW